MNEQCRIAFVGSHQEGKECLQEILDEGGNVVAIFTFTEDIAQKTSGAVSFTDIADQYDIPLYKVKNTNTPEAVAHFRRINPDIIFVIGWTRLVSNEILKIPKYGCIGMHASLLPKYRGRAPVNWALIHNETESGNTAILLDEGVDTGKIIAQKNFPITFSDTCETVYHKVAKAGRIMLRELLPILDNEGKLPYITQKSEEASVMPKRQPEDGIIDWNKRAMDLFNWIRALTHPYPGAFTYFKGEKLFIWEARIAHYPTINSQEFDRWQFMKSGMVVSVSDGIIVLTGDMELLSLHRLNFEDEDEMHWQKFLIIHPLHSGDQLG
jgi:methionyl-tRNA formyltransferase